MARLLIYPKQQRYNVRYEKNWIFIEANQFFYYFYLSFKSVHCFLKLLTYHKSNAGEKKNTVFLFASIYILLSIKVGLVRFGYIDKGIN